MDTDIQVRSQIGNENKLLLPAHENLEPGTHKIEWSQKMQVGPKWCGLLSPQERLLEAGESVVLPVIGTWPADIMINTQVFITKDTSIMSVWQIWTLPLVPDIGMQSQISSQKICYRWLGHSAVQAKVWTQDRNMAYILPCKVIFPLLAPLKHLYYSP